MKAALRSAGQVRVVGRTIGDQFEGRIGTQGVEVVRRPWVLLLSIQVNNPSGDSWSREDTAIFIFECSQN